MVREMMKLWCKWRAVPVNDDDDGRWEIGLAITRLLAWAKKLRSAAGDRRREPPREPAAPSSCLQPGAQPHLPRRGGERTADALTVAAAAAMALSPRQATGWWHRTIP